MRFNPRLTFKNMVNTIKLTKKSDKEVYKQHLRLVLFGISAIGGLDLSFNLHFQYSLVQWQQPE